MKRRKIDGAKVFGGKTQRKRVVFYTSGGK